MFRRRLAEGKGHSERVGTLGMLESMHAVALTAALAFASFGVEEVAEEGGRIRIAVLDPTPKGEVPEELPAALSSLAATTLKDQRAFDVITQDDVRQMLDFEANKQALGCEAEASCLAEIGGALGVPWLLGGNVVKLGDAWILTLNLIEIEKAKPIARETLSVDSISALTEQLPGVVEKLTAELLYQQAGELLVRTRQEGVEVSVDGVLIGTTPWKSAEAVAAGPRTVTASKDGFIQFKKEILVPPTETVELDVALVPSPELVASHRTFAWSLISVAGATAAGGLLAMAGGGGMFLWNELEVQQIREEKGVAPGAPVDVDESVLITQSLRDAGGFALLVTGGALLGTSVVVFFLAPPVGKYDDLVASE